MNHEDQAAELHGQFTDNQMRGRHLSVDMSGAPLPINEKDVAIQDEMYDKRESDVTSDAYRFTGEDGAEPSPEERATLRRIGDSMPLATWLVAIVELSERFTYYGASGLFPNYILKPLDGSLGRGALGLSTQAQNGLTTFFQFFCYITPILGAIIADQYLGRYKTIVMFMIVYIIGLLILLLTSLPVSLEHGAGLGGFITALIVIGFGTGGIKSNVAPLIADQYQRRKMALKTLKSGERVIIDPAITMQRIYMVFYWCINLGSLSLIATPYMEQDIGFWSAYLMCLCMFVVGFAVLLVAKKYYVVRPPQGGIIVQAFKVIGQMIKARNRDAPKPSYKIAHGKPNNNTWDDHFVDEVKRALIACQVFVLYPVYWVAYGQFSNNFVVQALEMNLHGIPNDLMQNFDPITIIVFIPILDRLVYPLLRKRGILLRPVTRIVIGFMIASMAMLYAAVLQYFIYKAGPCYGEPLTCDAGYPRIPGTNQPDLNGVHMGNNVHVAIQTPAYILIGLSEIFISVTGLEYAYTKSPPSMKSFVQSMYLLTTAFGAAISEALVPTAVDPRYQWLYVGICVACFITGIVFWFTFRHLNAQEEALNELSKDDPVLRRGSQIPQEDVEQNFGTGAASSIPIGDGKKI